MPKKLTQEEFISRVLRIHGDKYSYDKVLYKNSWTHVILNCPHHGDFLITPTKHLQGNACKKCGFESTGKALTKRPNDVIHHFIGVHGNKYDYSEVEYKGAFIQVKIICPVHGPFMQQPTNHLSGRGCPKCGVLKVTQKQTGSTDSFITKAFNVHGKRYDYANVFYINNSTKVSII